MAHHIAELIKTAEKERSPGKRRQAEKEATETILKIWEHREALPSYAYPLAQYEDLFKLLDRLQPSENPFRHSQNLVTRIDELAEVLFNNLSRLIMCLLLMKPLSIYSAKTVSEAAIEALSEEEKEVWSALQKWNELILPKARSKTQGDNSGGKVSPKKIDLKKIALTFVGGVKSAVDELQKELQKPTARSKPSAIERKGDARKSPKRRPKRKRD